LFCVFQERTLVGCPNEETKPDIQLSGLGIHPKHCLVEIVDNEVFVTPDDGARYVPYKPGCPFTKPLTQNLELKLIFKACIKI